MLRKLTAALITAHAVLSSPVGHASVALNNDEVWENAFRTPNATGSVRVKGFNLSTPFPGTESDDWAWTIQVRDGIPRSRDSKYATGIWVQLDMPDSLVRLAPNGTLLLDDGSWHVCENIWEFPALKSNAATVEGSCEGIVPKACHDLWTDTLAQGFGRRASNSSRCPSTTPPLRCLEALGKEYSGVGNTLDASYLRKNISEAGLLDYARTGLDEDIDGHQLGNYTAYDLAIQKVWLLGLTWGYSPASGRNSDNTEKVAASISCLRVNQIEPGSRPFSAGAASKAKPLRLMGFVFVSAVTFLCS